MNKAQLDELYHNLRVMSFSEDITQKEAVVGIVSHLTTPQGDYGGLLRFLNYYGDKYLLDDAVKLYTTHISSPNSRRIVEFGAGLGWLGRGLSNRLTTKPPLLIDKRQRAGIDIVADIESTNGAARVLDALDDSDVIVMSELLHCLDDARATMRQFMPWPKLIIEYMPKGDSFKSASYQSSYNRQIGALGCKPVSSIGDIFPGSDIYDFSTDTHSMWIVLS